MQKGAKCHRDKRQKIQEEEKREEERERERVTDSEGECGSIIIIVEILNSK